MNIKDVVKDDSKYELYEKYKRITKSTSSYEKMTKTKMISGILEFYNNYNNLINICTFRELKYLEKILDNKLDLLDDEYFFERTNLIQKLIICELDDGVKIISEIFDNVIEALGNVNYKEIIERDKTDEILIGSLKAFGYDFLDTFKEYVVYADITTEENLSSIIDDDKLFDYYVRVIKNKNGEKILVPYDYLDYFLEIHSKKELYYKEINIPLDAKKFSYMFYDVFDRNDIRVNKVLNKIKDTYLFQYNEVLDMIRKNIILGNKEDIIRELRDNNFSTSHLKLLEEFFDDIPMSILNGYTFNQYNSKNLKKVKVKHEKQVNAVLSIRDRNEFSKCYTALLDFTNKKFKINNRLTLYEKNFIVDVVEDIVLRFWENKEDIIKEFCLKNPYNFSENELNSVKQFNKGFNGKFLLYKYDKDYCEFVLDDRIYMVKGINENIDGIISNKELPCFLNTNIVDFNGKIVCDCIFMNGKVNSNINWILDNIKNMKKYYRLDR